MAKYDLEERTMRFARDAAIMCKTLPRSTSNLEYSKQLIRSSGSVGSNYLEANESLRKKDFIMRVRISRKEAKESIYWLKLISETNSGLIIESINTLIGEGVELKRSFQRS